MKKIICFLIICLFLVSCVSKNKSQQNYSTIEDSSNDTNKISSNVDDRIPINICDAEYDVQTVYKNIINPLPTNKAGLFQCESVQIINGKVYYLVRGFNNMEDHIATFGWYFVDIYTGEVFDAGPDICELLPIKGK